MSTIIQIPENQYNILREYKRAYKNRDDIVLEDDNNDDHIELEQEYLLKLLEYKRKYLARDKRYDDGNVSESEDEFEISNDELMNDIDLFIAPSEYIISDDEINKIIDKCFKLTVNQVEDYGKIPLDYSLKTYITTIFSEYYKNRINLIRYNNIIINNYKPLRDFIEYCNLLRDEALEQIFKEYWY
jgi:hypothetical protein